MNWFRRKKEQTKDQRPKTKEQRLQSSVFSLQSTKARKFTSYLPLTYLLPLTSKFRLFIPVLLALFTGFLMIHTAAVLSDPAFPFIQADWSAGVPADSTACAAAGGNWNSGTSECFAALTGYTGYSVKDSGVDVSANNIKLQSTSYTATQTSDVGA